jgi:hypothetical protein
MAPSRTAPAAVGKLTKAAAGALATASAKLAGQDPAVGESSTPDVVPPAALPKARVTPLVRAYRRAEKRVDAAKEALDEAKAAIVEAMGAADVLQVEETGRPVAEFKTVESLRFNQTRFRSEHPTEASEYMEPQSARRFRVLT